MSKATGINEAGAINQIINSLHFNLMEIRSLIRGGNHYDALRLLRDTYHIMKAEDRDQELNNKIQKLVDNVRNRQQAFTNNHRLNAMEKIIEEWTDEVSDQLHEKGYFTFEKYSGFWNPSGGQKSGTIHTRPGLAPQQNARAVGQSSAPAAS